MLAITNWRKALQAATPDASVGIAHSPLTGDLNFRLHVTELPPGAKVSAHLHTAGEEVYIISAGSGTLYTGHLDGAAVSWNEPLSVQSGDTFTISPGMIHQLHNTSEVPLILIFGCPDAHLSTDRQIVEDFAAHD